mgnify:CR=1 FL=1
MVRKLDGVVERIREEAGRPPMVPLRKGDFGRGVGGVALDVPLVKGDLQGVNNQ